MTKTTVFHLQESPGGELSSPLTPVTPPMENINGTDEICDSTPNSDALPGPAQNALAFAHRYVPPRGVLTVSSCPHYAPSHIHVSHRYAPSILESTHFNDFLCLSEAQNSAQHLHFHHFVHVHLYIYITCQAWW